MHALKWITAQHATDWFCIAFYIMLDYMSGSNISSPWPELFSDVWHLVWGPGDATSVLCISELVGHHNTIHRHHSDGARG